MEISIKDNIRVLALYIINTEKEDFKEWTSSLDAEEEKHIYETAIIVFENLDKISIL